MIDLTPLDVRKKRGDFRKSLRGYDPQEVDTFLELAAERLEVLVKENLALKERAEVLSEQVTSQEAREKAVQEALVTAQTLRDEIAQQAGNEAKVLKEQSEREARMLTEQAEREARQLREQAEAEVAQIKEKATGDAELLRREAESELERLTIELEALIEEKTGALEEMERKRKRFLRAFRSLLERELDGVAIEEGKVASEDAILELDLTGGSRRTRARMIETAALDLLGDEDGEGGPLDDSIETEAADVGEEPAVVASAPVDAPTESEETGPSVSPGGESADAASSVPDHPVGEAVEPPVPTPSAGEGTTFEMAADRTDDTETATEAPAGSHEGAPLDQAWEAARADSGGEATASTEAADEDGLESLVDRVLSEEGSADRGPIPIGALAPEEGVAEDPSEEAVLELNARSAVSELFDADVPPPAPAPEAVEEDVASAWDQVLRGDDEEDATEAPDAEAPPAGGLAPNFPERERSEEGSAWSRRRGQSRWR